MCDQLIFRLLFIYYHDFADLTSFFLQKEEKEAKEVCLFLEYIIFEENLLLTFVFQNYSERREGDERGMCCVTFVFFVSFFLFVGFANGMFF